MVRAKVPRQRRVRVPAGQCLILFAMRPLESTARMSDAKAWGSSELRRTQKKPANRSSRAFQRNNAGSDLLSHTLSHAVPSAVSGLTSVFGMGTGVTLIL